MPTRQQISISHGGLLWVDQTSSDGGGPCEWERVCPRHEPWSAAQAGRLERLAFTTCSDIARIDSAIEGGTYQPPADFAGHRIRTGRHGTRT